MNTKEKKEFDIPVDLAAEREFMLANVFWTNIRNDFEITAEKVSNSLRMFILDYLRLDESEACTDDIMQLCRISTAKDFKIPVEKLDEKDLPDKSGLSEFYAQSLILVTLIEYSLKMELPADEIKDIEKITEFSEYLYKKLKNKIMSVNFRKRTTYFENGKIAGEMFYVDEVLHGICKEYDSETANLISEICYDKGVLHGLSKNYTKEGWLYYTTNYYDGEQEGLKTQYYKNGNKMLEEDFYEGYLHGWCKTFNEDGELMVQDLYDEDVLVERYVYKTGTVKYFDYTDELKKNLYGRL
jgi:antitoxin component YwqK of YwqJK toxin-antitoxin module